MMEALENIARSAGKQLADSMAPSCFSCPMRKPPIVLEEEHNGGTNMLIRTACTRKMGEKCPDGLVPDHDTHKAKYSIKDFGMFRKLGSESLQYRMTVPNSILLDHSMKGMKGKTRTLFVEKVIDDEIANHESEIVNEWWSLLDHLGALKRSWHGNLYYSHFSPAKSAYVKDHIYEVRRENLSHGSLIRPTTYMKDNMPKEVVAPFPAYHTVKSHQEPRPIEHPGSKPSVQKFTPPPPPRYHNWGSWGS